MEDDKTNKGMPDKKRISLKELCEVSYWTKELNVTVDVLRKAVAAVGDSVTAVRKHLGK